MQILKTFSGRKASQNFYELTCFTSLLKERGVTKYLEIGARDGDTFHYVISKLPRGSYGLAVDLPGGLWGKSTTAISLRKAVANLRTKGYNVHYILGDSTAPEIIAQVQSHGKFDAALIDGDHTLEGARKDWNNYKDISPIIAFHDIVGEGQFERVKNNPVQVPILWSEIKGDYEHQEFIDVDSKMGIGVIFKD